MAGWLSNLFNKDKANVPTPAPGMEIASETTAPVQPIGPEYQPSKGNFFRTQEFPETDAQGQPIGKAWMEAGADANGNWVLWQKSLKTTDDVLAGTVTSVLSSRLLFEKTSFVNCYDQMTTYETSQQSMGFTPLPNKTPAKMGGDYYKQFAWREGLMMSRSGRLYPLTDDKVSAANYFNEKNITDATEFMRRLKAEQFVPVPINLPTTDWAKAYAARKDVTDQRLNVLYNRYNNEQNSFELAQQIIGNEVPEVLYAHMQRGFNPKMFEANPAQHFALLKAAIDRPNVEVLNLLSEAGVSFYVRQNEQTPIEMVLDQKRYSHLHVMLTRDGAALANYADETGVAPAVQAVNLQDNQAFRMLYLEGLDFSAADSKGWLLIHHAFASSFMRGIYAWLDEGLSIDAPIKDTNFTGVSIAKEHGNQPLIDFAVKNGANADAPALSESTGAKADFAKAANDTAPTLPFDVALLNSGATNDEILRSAEAHVSAGNSLNILDAKGNAALELCWKNRKAKPELDRRALVNDFARLGADPAAQLPDGTTVLNRAVSGATLDMDFLKAMAPLASNVNGADAKGNNVLHALQLNNNETVGLSNQIDQVLKVFPQLDLNAQNAAGYSNIGLAIRLDRTQTLKILPPVAVDWSQTTAQGWSYLDIAFTKACAQERIPGNQRAERTTAVSDKMREIVLDMLDATPQAQRAALSAAVHRQRPDDQILVDAMADEAMPEAMIQRLKKFDTLKQAIQKPKLPQPPT